MIIIWQGGLEVNPSILIGSFLVRDFALQTVSIETVISRVFFGFQKPANLKFAAKTSAIA